MTTKEKKRRSIFDQSYWNRLADAMTAQLKSCILRTVCQTMLEAVAAGGSTSAPSGVMYSALMGKISLGQFEQIMGALEETGMVKKTGHVYFITEKGISLKLGIPSINQAK